MDRRKIAVAGAAVAVLLCICGGLIYFYNSLGEEEKPVQARDISIQLEDPEDTEKSEKSAETADTQEENKDLQADSTGDRNSGGNIADKTAGVTVSSESDSSVHREAANSTSGVTGNYAEWENIGQGTVYHPSSDIQEQGNQSGLSGVETDLEEQESSGQQDIPRNEADKPEDPSAGEEPGRPETSVPDEGAETEKPDPSQDDSESNEPEQPEWGPLF